MKKLHPIQEKLAEILINNQDDPLTIRELQELMGVSSTSIVHHHLVQLEKKGYLRRNPTNPGDYQVVNSNDSPERKITYLNLYGLAACGPKGSILDGIPIERVPISSKILGFSSADAFMLKAKGKSMEPKIGDGDLVIVRKTNHAENGNIIVCVNNGEVLIKKLKKDSEIILISLNPKFEPFVASDDFRIEGVVRSVLSYTK